MKVEFESFNQLRIVAETWAEQIALTTFMEAYWKEYQAVRCNYDISISTEPETKKQNDFPGLIA